MFVLLDSGIYISALQFGGAPKESIIQAVMNDTLLTCAQIEEEVVRVMRDKFAHDPIEVSRLFVRYVSDATQIYVPGALKGVCRDSKDDFLLECAILGHADVIVTGDKDLLSLQTYKSVKIITPRQYLDQFQYR